MVHHTHASVHSNPPALRLDESTLPLSFEGEVAPYEPDELEQAYWTAFRLAEEGEQARTPNVAQSNPIGLRWARGTSDGKRARAANQAFELGKAMGLTTEISEPPTGFFPHEAEAYRRGFAAGQRELIAEEWAMGLWESCYEPGQGADVTDFDLWSPDMPD